MKKFFEGITLIIMMAIAATVAFAQQDQVARQGVVDLAGGLKEEAQKRQELAKDVEDLKNRPPTVQTRVTGLSEARAKKMFLEVGGLGHQDQLYFNLRLLGFTPEQVKVEISKYLSLKGEIKTKERLELIESWLKRANFATKNEIEIERKEREASDKALENKIPKPLDPIAFGQVIAGFLKENGFVTVEQLNAKADKDQVFDLQTKVNNLGEKVDTKADKAEVEELNKKAEDALAKAEEATDVAESAKGKAHEAKVVADATATTVVTHLVESHKKDPTQGGFLFWGGRKVSREQLLNFKKQLEAHGLSFWGRVSRDRHDEVRKFLGEKETHEEPEEEMEE